MSVKRGGQTLKEGYIGRNNILRQQILMPGERMNVRMKGKVRMETLRERDACYIQNLQISLRTFEALLSSRVATRTDSWDDHTEASLDRPIGHQRYIEDPSLQKGGLSFGRQVKCGKRPMEPRVTQTRRTVACSSSQPKRPEAGL